MTAVLIDTSILIDYLRNRQEAVEFLEGKRSRPSVSVITLMELIAGARSQREERLISSPMEIVRILPVTVEIGRRAGEFLKHYEASHGIDDGDALIAATAEHHGLDLATLNVEHFPMFPRLKPPY